MERGRKHDESTTTAGDEQETESFAMTFYRTDGTTRRHGIVGAVFAVFILGGGLACLYFAQPERHLSIVDVVCAVLVVTGLWILPFSVRHVIQPELTYVEVSDESLVWRDWKGFSMSSVSYPLACIRAVARPDESPDCLILDDGSKVFLPAFIIPDTHKLWEAMSRADPRIELRDQ